MENKQELIDRLTIEATSPYNDGYTQEAARRELERLMAELVLEEDAMFNHFLSISRLVGETLSKAKPTASTIQKVENIQHDGTDDSLVVPRLVNEVSEELLIRPCYHCGQPTASITGIFVHVGSQCDVFCPVCARCRAKDPLAWGITAVSAITADITTAPVVDLERRNTMNEQELNMKLADWAGFIKTFSGDYLEPDGDTTIRDLPRDLPNFTQSLDNCYEWLVPKLREQRYYIILRDISKSFHCSLIFITADKRSLYGKADTPALALCLAISKLIDEES